VTWRVVDCGRGHGVLDDLHVEPTAIAGSIRGDELEPVDPLLQQKGSMAGLAILADGDPLAVEGQCSGLAQMPAEDLLGLIGRGALMRDIRVMMGGMVSIVKLISAGSERFPA
jgi:hypothetical protein